MKFRNIRNLSAESKEKLIDAILEFIRNDQDILMQTYPLKDKRFDKIKLTHFLGHRKDFLLRKKYFNGLVDVMVDQFTDNAELGRMNAWSLANHLTHSLDLELVDPAKIEKLASLVQQELIKGYSEFEALSVKNELTSMSGYKPIHQI